MQAQNRSQRKSLKIAEAKRQIDASG